VGVEPEAEKPQPEFTKRITIAVTEDVHTRLKVACAARRLQMADVLRNWVETDLKTLEAT
jgi:hypothetical protein